MPTLSHLLPNEKFSLSVHEEERQRQVALIKNVIPATLENMSTVKKPKDLPRVLKENAEKALYPHFDIPPKPKGAEIRRWNEDNKGKIEIATGYVNYVSELIVQSCRGDLTKLKSDEAEAETAKIHNNIKDILEQNLPVGRLDLEYPIDCMINLGKSLTKQDGDQNKIMKSIDAIDSFISSPNFQAYLKDIDDLSNLCVQLAGLKQFLNNRKIRTLREFLGTIDYTDQTPETAIFKAIDELLPLDPKYAFLKACSIEAMFDLLDGQLHRLDPVIRDAGCQWRIPFIIDLKYAVRKFSPTIDINEAAKSYGKCLKKLKTPPTMEFMGNLIDGGIINDGQYVSEKQKETKTTSFKDTVSIRLPTRLYKSVDTFPFVQLVQQIPEDVLKLLKEFSGFINSLTIGDIIHFQTKTRAVKPQNSSRPLNSIWNMDGTEQTNTYRQKTTGDCESKPTAVPVTLQSTMDYLSMCKALTVRQIRYMDAFGLSSHSIPLTLPYFEGPEFEDYQTRLATYSYRYLEMAFDAMAEAPGLQEVLNTGVEPGGISMVHNLVAMHKNLKTPYYRVTLARGPVLSYYENKRLVYLYLFFRNIPITLDVKRLICTETGEKRDIKKPAANGMEGKKLPAEATHKYSGGGVYLFVPNYETGRFELAKNPTDDQKSSPALCVETYSMFNKNMKDAEKIKQCADVALLTNCNRANAENYGDFEQYLKSVDLIDIFLKTTIHHSAFPGGTVILDGTGTLQAREITEESLMSYCEIEDDDIGGFDPADTTIPLIANQVNGQSWNIKKEKAFIRRFNPLTKYAAKSDISDDKLLTARAKLTYPLGSIHLYACTFKDIQTKYHTQEEIRQERLGKDYATALSDVLDIRNCMKLIF